LFEVQGTRDNNVVLAGQPPFSHNFAPFLDTRPGLPGEQRYKALAGTSEKGLFGFVSADGLHWRKLGEAPLVTKGAFDSQNVAFWSDAEQCYALYLREKGSEMTIDVFSSCGRLAACHASYAWSMKGRSIT